MAYAEQAQTFLLAMTDAMRAIKDPFFMERIVGSSHLLDETTQGYHAHDPVVMHRIKQRLSEMGDPAYGAKDKMYLVQWKHCRIRTWESPARIPPPFIEHYEALVRPWPQ